MRFISKLEWEGLQKGYEIKTPFVSELLPSSIERIEIYRNDAYQINAKFQGKVSDEDELGEWIDKWNKLETDNFIIPLNFEISDNIGTYKLNHCFFNFAESFPEFRRDRNLNYSFLRFEANFFVSNLHFSILKL